MLLGSLAERVGPLRKLEELFGLEIRVSTQTNAVLPRKEFPF